MANKNIQIRPKGTGDYADVLHPETNIAQVVGLQTELNKVPPLKEQLDSAMPFRQVENGKTYRWGMRMVSGKLEYIREEIV